MRTKQTTILFVYAVIQSCFLIQSQDLCHNYVMVVEPEHGSASVPQIDSSRVEITYYDGLGHPMQYIQIGQGGGGEDIVSMTAYNNRGFIEKEWQPVPFSSTGSYIPSETFQHVSNYYYGEDSHPYTTFFYKDGVIPRRYAMRSPGFEWRYTWGHKTERRHNQEDECRKFVLSADLRTLTDAGYYLPGTLCAESVTDEDGHTQTVYTNNAGQEVMRRDYDGVYSLDSYKIYCPKGLLRYDISPKAALLLSHFAQCDSTVLNSLCHYYDYDEHHRLIEMCPPGVSPIDYVYDRLNRLIMSQDGTQRVSSEWSIYKYDCHRHLAVEGHAKLQGSTRQGLQTVWGDSLLIEIPVIEDNQEYDLFYSNKSGPYGFVAERSYFYNGYTHWGKVPLPVSEDYPIDISMSSQGLLTGGAVMDNGIVKISAIVYDQRGRVIMESERDWYSNVMSHTTFSRYSHQGLLLCRLHVGRILAEGSVTEEHTAEWRYSYDRGGRQSQTELRIDGSAWRKLVRHIYDGVGRLLTTIPFELQDQAITYKYNTRWQEISRESSVYVQRLYYATQPFDRTASVYLNGCLNASEHISTQDGMPQEHKFTYIYDRAGRIIGASTPDGNYMEQTEYDANCNPLYIFRRYDGTTIQDMSIIRNGNQIESIYDVSDDTRLGEVAQILSGSYPETVCYDANGRIIRDNSRGISSISYHRIGGYPHVLHMEDGSYIINEYRPDCKLSRRVEYSRKGNAQLAVTRREWIGEWERINYAYWRIPTGSGHAEVDMRTGSISYSHYVNDHLGSTRVVIDPSGRVLQMTGYYPSGLPFNQYGGYSATNRLHIGKPYLEVYGIGYYDNVARIYDPITSSFISQDPYQSEYHWLSPYNFCAGNPLSYTDPTGKFVLFEPGTTQEYIEDFNLAVKYMQNHGACENINSILTSDRLYFVGLGKNAETGLGNSFNPKTNTINWLNRKAIVTETNYVLTPAEILEHEASHAIRYEIDKDGIIEDALEKDDDYGNKEERRVIVEVETNNAIKLGKLRKGEITRRTHFGNLYDVQSPISDEFEGVVVMP